MNTFLLLSILIIFLFFDNGFSRTINPNKREYVEKIVGGSGATTAQYPYQLAIVQILGNSIVQFCEASIITKDYAISAGHCFRDVTGSSNIDTSISNRAVVSTTFLNQITSNKKFNILEVHFHPTYSFNVSQQNRVDLCVLKVMPISFDATTQPILLARPVGIHKIIEFFDIYSDFFFFWKISQCSHKREHLL